MRPRTLPLPVLVSAILTLVQVPACGLNTSGALESEVDEDAGVLDAQAKGGSAGASGGSAVGGKGGAAGKAGQGGASGQGGSSGAGNSAGAGGAGEGGTSGNGGSSETGGSAGAGGNAGTAGQGGATPDGGAGSTGQGGAVQDSGPDLDAAPDVIEAGPDSGPTCALQDTGHPECNACMMQNCMSACQTCAGNSECVVLVNCIAGCNGNSGCQSDCWDDHPDGHDGADMLGGKDGCLRDHCDSQCSWLPDIPSSGCTVSPAAPADQTGSFGWLIGAVSAAAIAIAVARRRPGR